MPNENSFRSTKQSAIERFNEYLPNNPFCSHSKKIEGPCHKDSASSYEYIQINFPTVRYLAFDLDYHSAVTAALDRGLPEPTLTVVNKENQHCHYMYELLYPLPRKYSRSTKALLGDVVGSYKDILCADKCIISQKQLVKNPLHNNKWNVIDSNNNSGIFTLGELAEYIPVEWKLAASKIRRFEAPSDIRIKTFDETLEKCSRNCSLFKNGRYYAYSIIYDCGSYEELYNCVLNWILYLNDSEIPKHFSAKLPHSDLRSIARSIASWTYRNRNYFKRVNRGAMNLPSMKGKRWTSEEYNREVRHRRSLAASRTNKMRRETTEEKIMDTISQCRVDGLTPNISLISRMAGIPRKTVAYYKDLINI